MPFLEWSDDFLTGIRKMDEQHKEWLRILNKFYDTVNMENLPEKLAALLDEAIAYTEFHFREEEAMLAKHRFPDLTLQKKEHERIKKELLAFKGRLEGDLLYISKPVTDDMKDWFYNHVTGLDRNYGSLPE